MSENQRKACFVISPIGESDSDTRRRSDQVLRHIIRPAVETCGYDAIRADEIDRPGLITSQVIQHVVNDPLVIADLTERNPNVFYELAIRHAIRKPLVQIITKGESIPFDVAGTRTIHVDHHDLDSVDLAKKEIIEQIEALEHGGSDIETPISVSLDLQILRQSENPEDRSLADIVSVVSEMRASFSKLQDFLLNQGSFNIRRELHDAAEPLIERLGEIMSIVRHSSSHHSVSVDSYLVSKLGTRVARESSGVASVIVSLSMFRDAAPWVYELGMEALRRMASNDDAGFREILKELRVIIRFTFDNIQMRDMLQSGDNLAFFLEDLPDQIEKLAFHRKKSRKISIE